MILTLVAVQMFLGGIRVFVENLRRRCITGRRIGGLKSLREQIRVRSNGVFA
jgi:hypothetical protein